MNRLLALALAVAAAGAIASPAGANGIKRLYALDCGRQIAKDQSRWTPGINVGQTIEFSNNCYLIQHERGMLLWDTGLPDSVAERKEGFTAPNGALTMFRDKTLLGQLAELGVKPDDIALVAISHSHGDHTGNLKAFGKAKILMQRLEYDAAMKIIPKPIADGQDVMMLSGDHDVFGDGSVTIISTPGHTPGHQSLLVKLPKTGAVVLTGDFVHLKMSWEKGIVPGFNFDKDQSLTSIVRMRGIAEQNKAQLWIGHDKDVTATVQRAPKYYE